jgi:pimeloyl-ACP methyl ester carboxylesterase
MTVTVETSPLPGARASVQRTRIAVRDEDLTDLRARLRMTRWTPKLAGEGWDYGTDIGYLQALVSYWADEFDWRAAEARLNERENVLVDVGGTGVHAVLQRAADPAAPVVVLLHGWPDSFLRFDRILPELTDLTVVVPSLPGYGLSEHPLVRGVSPARMAEILMGLMTELGFERFVVHGGDVGAGVGEEMARGWPDRITGLHLVDIPYWHMFGLDRDAVSEPEKEFLAAAGQWQQTEGGYAAIQGSRPQTLAVGLDDSPAGLASWLVDKLRSWSDCDGDVERVFPRDALLTNFTLYWVTQSIGTSFLVYREPRQDFAPDLDRPSVPTALATFPKDTVPPPREYAERFFRVVRWTEMPYGGHFGAWEAPNLLAEDLRGFVADHLA